MHMFVVYILTACVAHSLCLQPHAKRATNKRQQASARAQHFNVSIYVHTYEHIHLKLSRPFPRVHADSNISHKEKTRAQARSFCVETYTKTFCAQRHHTPPPTLLRGTPIKRVVSTSTIVPHYSTTTIAMCRIHLTLSLSLMFGRHRWNGCRGADVFY